MREKTGRWDGYSDVLRGAPLKDEKGQYGIGVYLARRHLEEFSSKDAHGRSYLEAQEDAMKIEHQNREGIDRRLGRLSKRAALAMQDILNLSDLPEPYNEIVDAKKMIRIIKRELQEIQGEQRDLLRAKNCPCSNCEAHAMCGALSIACSGFVRWVGSSRASSIVRKQVPTSEAFAQLQIDS